MKLAMYNDEQNEAIESVGNVIVSAGAGSGKTTVLTERVRQNILGLTKNGKVKLNELLILTFTNDAATSMKNKIKKALSKDNELSSLVPYVDSAHIETFDAYSQFIVKKYGYLIGISKNINVLDADILSVKVANTISSLIDKQYEKDSEVFNELIFNYCIKSDKKLFNFLLDIYNKILFKTDDPIEYLKNYKEKYLTTKSFDDFVCKAEDIYLSTKKELERLTGSIDDTDLLTYCNSVIASYGNANTLDELIKIHDSLEPSDKCSKKTRDTLKGNEGINAIYEKEIGEQFIKNYKKIYRLSSFNKEEYFKIDVPFQIKFLTYLIDQILIPTINEVEEFKRSTGYYTFNDIAKMAIEILEKREDVRNELKNLYKLIMIDETQDTSASQEKFIDLIANNNVFSVGDIKQSIYRFRNAKPELFKKKYDKYSLNNGGRAINMNKNYRSRKEILNTINDMFSKLMRDDFGGANYAKDHMIEAENKDYDKYGSSEIEHGIFQLPFSGIYFDEEGELEKNKEARIRGEASAICDNIISRIKNGYKVYDSEKKCLRNCSFKDFTILTYKSKKFKVFEEVFKEKNVPLNAIYTDNLNEDLSIVVLINIFSLISLLSKDTNSLEEESNIKHLLASILRSFIFEYSDQDLYEIFKDKGDNYKNNEIYKLILDLAKNYAKGSLKLLFDEVIKRFNYLKAFSKVKDAINTLDKNNIFYNKTKTMDELGYTLDDFVLYLKSLSKFSITMEQVVYTEASDAVTITTIHKSKGLEYPLVYLPNLFDFTEPEFKNKGDFYVLNGQYFFLPFFSDPHKDTDLLGLILESDDSITKEDKEERLRLFYVALTRAKEDLVLVLSDDRVKSYNEVYEEYFNRVKKRIEKRKIKLSEEEIKEIAHDELNDYVKKHDGANFNDFLFNAFISYPIDPYMDSRILDIDKMIDERTKDAKVEIKKQYKNSLFKYYFTHSHTLEGLNFDQIEESIKDSESKTKIKASKNSTNVLFKGAIKVFDEYLTKVTLDTYSDDKEVLNFEFYAYKSISKRTQSKEEVNKITSALNKGEKNVIEHYLEPFFNSNYDFEQEFLKIPTQGIKKINELHIPKIEIVKMSKASKDIDETSDETVLNYGTHIHSLLETISFKNPNYDFIENERERYLIKNALESLKQFNLDNSKIFKEYQFIDETNNHKGIIDLLIVQKDKAIVVDYKLKNISDKEYVKQLKVYKDFVEEAFKIKTECYLLSIIDKTMVKIL